MLHRARLNTRWGVPRVWGRASGVLNRGFDLVQIGTALEDGRVVLVAGEHIGAVSYHWR
jgi:hypothetical protein